MILITYTVGIMVTFAMFMLLEHGENGAIEFLIPVDDHNRELTLFMVALLWPVVIFLMTSYMLSDWTQKED